MAIVNIVRDSMLWFVYENILISLVYFGLRPIVSSVIDNEALSLSPTICLGGYPEKYEDITFYNCKLSVCNHFNNCPVLAECGSFVVLSQRLLIGNETICVLSKLRVVNKFSIDNKLNLVLGRCLTLLTPSTVQTAHKFHYSTDISSSNKFNGIIFRSASLITASGYVSASFLGTYVHSYCPIVS